MMNQQNIYERNKTNMANLNTLVQVSQEEDTAENKNEYGNTYYTKQPVNFRGDADLVQNSNVNNKTKFSDTEKQQRNNDVSGLHKTHGKKKKKCSIL